MTDEQGGAIVAWQDFRSNSRSENYALRLRISGRVDADWPSNGRLLGNGVDNQNDVRIVPDGAGGAVLAWEAWGGPQENVIHVHHLTATGVLDPAWPIDGRALSNPPGVQIEPVLASDGAGGAIVAWLDYRDGIGDVYAQHVLASGNVDPGWPSDGLAVCTAPGVQIPFSIVSDGCGGAIVAWYDRRDGGETGDPYAQHILSNGAVDPLWPRDGRALSTAIEDQGNLVMVADGSGGAIAAWTDTRSSIGGVYSGYYDIYAQHILASGTLNSSWPTDGLPVSIAPQDQIGPVIVTDGRGGAIITWGDLRASSGGDIYAQHLLPSGVDSRWPVDGLMICGTGTADGGLAMTADSFGGALIVWGDRRGTVFDVYAHHVTASGLDSSWPPNGRVISDGPSYQIEVAVTADRHGRAVVAWRDFRNGNADIYALRLNVNHTPQPLRPPLKGSFSFELHKSDYAATLVALDFELTAIQAISIRVYDVTGRLVRTLYEHREFSPGPHTVTWDSADDSGALVRPGLYLVRLSNGDRSVTRKHITLGR